MGEWVGKLMASARATLDASDRITLSPARSSLHGEESLLSAWCIASPQDANCTSTHMNPTMYGTRLRHHLPLAIPYSQLFIIVLAYVQMQDRVAGGS